MKKVLCVTSNIPTICVQYSGVTSPKLEKTKLGRPAETELSSDKNLIVADNTSTSSKNDTQLILQADEDVSFNWSRSSSNVSSSSDNLFLQNVSLLNDESEEADGLTQSADSTR